MVPSHGPLETACLQGEGPAGIRGPRPLGAAMVSFCFAHPRKYCHNGGMAFAHHHGVGLPGVHDGDHGPFQRSPENMWFAGEKFAGSGGPCPLGAAMGSSAFFFRAHKYCHNGGSPSPPGQAAATPGWVRARGSPRHYGGGQGNDRPRLRPCLHTQKMLICRQKDWWGAKMRVLWVRRCARLRCNA
jgi:hypothetical protein